MLKRLFLPLVVIAIAIFVFVLLKQSNPERQLSNKPEKVWRVNTTPVDIQTISPEITLYGRVESPRKSTLKSALIADVIAAEILEGSFVKAGDLLIQLDDTDVQLLLAQRQADLAEIQASIDSENKRFSRDHGLLKQETELLKLAEKSVARNQKLSQTHLMTEASLDEALAAKQSQLLTLKRLNFDIAEHPARLAQLLAKKQRAQALLKQAQVDISRSQIIAPFDGVITQLNVSKGDRVRTGDSLISLYDRNKLEVRAQIPGRYSAQIYNMINNEVTLTASSQISGKNHLFSLARLSGEIKQDSGGVDGLFTLGDDKTGLILGSFIELTLTLALQENVFTLPFNALYGLDHIYKINEGYLQSITIERVGELSDEEGSKQLLLRSSQVQQGDHIVSTQLPNAITGLRVEAMK